MKKLTIKQWKLISCALYHTFSKLGVEHLHGDKYKKEAEELQRIINLSLKEWNGVKDGKEKERS